MNRLIQEVLLLVSLRRKKRHVHTLCMFVYWTLLLFMCVCVCVFVMKYISLGGESEKDWMVHISTYICFILGKSQYFKILYLYTCLFLCGISLSKLIWHASKSWEIIKISYRNTLFKKTDITEQPFFIPFCNIQLK